MAFGVKLTAALSGASEGQLSYWRRPPAKPGGQPILVPEISVRPVRYSFRDIIALRMCVFLREDVPLRRIRSAIANLRSRLQEQSHLSSYKLVATEDGSVAMVYEEGAVDLVKKPGQHVIAEMSDVLAPFLNDKRGIEVPALFHPRPGLVVDEEIRGGFPVVTGTRVPYDVVAGLVADGVSPEHVRDFYPTVSASAARDAAEFAAYVDRAHESLLIAAGRRPRPAR